MQKAFIFLLFFPFYGHTQIASKFGYDSVRVQTSTKYADPSVFKRFFLGTNYRKEWETLVTLPVFNLSGMGFTITELGGQQTKSLRMVDKKEKEWVLRTVDKDVEKALPKYLRHTLAQRVTQDMVSAAHPFAPLTVNGLAKAIGIIAPTPFFYFVPDDAAFGAYRNIFANTVCLLEQREPTPNNKETKSTEKLLENLEDENDHLVIQQAVLKARLLDMLIADWDRHADQWRWGVIDLGKVEYYYGIPRDRDQAFFYSDGVLVKVARIFGLRHLVGFKNDLSGLKNLNYKSWQFDATLLNDLDKGDWSRIIKEVQAALPDTVIDNAVKKLPPEVYPISGPEVEGKLKSRRDQLLSQGLKYYQFIARSITVTGSNERELFTVKKHANGALVQVFEYKGGKAGHKMYDRVIAAEETSEVTLTGLDGTDHFVIDEDATTRIKFIINGGSGSDVYQIKGKVRNTIHDTAADNNTIEKGRRTKLILK